ncbi:MAG: S41 family peptidase [Bacteroidales bacterium]
MINIQDNSGGATNYWKKNIVERLISDTIVYTSYPIIKDGPVNRHFYGEFFDEARLLKKTEYLERIPDELINKKFYIKTERDTIVPNNPINFKGQIFLLVNEKVFSSSEGFAQFCKTTEWAVVAGERTGGDGIGSDPALIILPESGILMGFPSLVGLNHNGSLNSEEKTTPDIEIEAANSQGRLEKLIKYLKEKE